jgi:ubiquinone/menaquinone biosynthesis C-methylase UbiE
MIVTRQPPTYGASPFDGIAEQYDACFTHSKIGRTQRLSVWQELDRHFQPGQRVLDINCGTGEDALHLADRGIRVVSFDASAEMITVARRKSAASAHRNHLDFRVLAIEQMNRLATADLYDGVLSNFAGLNCVADLRFVVHELARLVKPGGRVILCLFGRFCLWEIVWYALHRNLKKAFRRFRGKAVIASLAPGHTVFVEYPSVRSLQQDFATHFRLLGWKGTGVLVPPSYLEQWAVRFPRLFAIAAWIDPVLGRSRGFRSLADHVVVVLEKLVA